MNDQASTLRLIASNDSENKKPVREDQTEKTQTKTSNNSNTAKTIAISGGKGGVGKSNLAVNLALELGSLNKNVTLLDADFGLANADLLCGVTPKSHLGHVIAGWKKVEDIMIHLSSKVSLLPGGSGVEALANMSIDSHAEILQQLQDIESETDFMLIDTAAGIAENVVGVLISADEVIIVATPDPTSIVDAYATIKVILRHSPEKPISVVVNNVVGVGDAEQVFEQINQVVNHFLEYRIKFLGMIPNDLQLKEAVREQVPVTEYAPKSPSSRAIRLIAKQIANKNSQIPMDSSEYAQTFWGKLASD